MYGYVYKTIDKTNGKLYIGQKKGEFNPKYYGSGLLIQRAIGKRGIKSFKLNIIAYASTKEELDELEKRYITEYRKQFTRDGLYNITDGGEGNCSPRTTRFKMMVSKALKGRKTWNTGIYGYSSPGISKALTGRTRVFTPKHKENLSLSAIGRIPWNKGKPWTSQMKTKLSLSLKKYYQTKRGLCIQSN